MKALRLFLVLALVGAAIFFLGIRPRLQAHDALARRAAAVGTPIVNVAIAKSAATTSALTLPATLQPFQSTPIYARTAGYVAEWKVDLGDRVTAGQVLATIDAPELDQEIAEAVAALDQAKANLALASSSVERWDQLGQSNAVPKQEVDERRAAFNARGADVNAADAGVKRVQQMKTYQSVRAPFAGVVSARNAEVGQLVSTSGGEPLFRIDQIDSLRVYVNVPQSYARSVEAGLDADIILAEYPGQKFAGKIVRSAAVIDAGSRTLRTEVQVPNKDGVLLAGMFAQVHLKLKPTVASVLVPANTLIVRGTGVFVATVDQESKIRMRKITLGRDFGATVEVQEGLEAGARIVPSPSDALAEGMLVEVNVPKPVAPAAKS